jgi:hypothetical protein
MLSYLGKKPWTDLRKGLGKGLGEIGLGKLGGNMHEDMKYICKSLAREMIYSHLVCRNS